MTNSITEVAIADIVERKELMPRKGVSPDVVMDYKASLELLPPILLGVDAPKNEDEEAVSNNGSVYVLLDGWHRLRAHAQAAIEEGRFKIVTVGDKEHKVVTKTEAIRAIVDEKIDPNDFRAVAARKNKAHGRRLTADEKRTIARKLYLEEERTVDFITDVIGCSPRHTRRLTESFERGRKDLKMEQAFVLSKKKNPDTKKKYTIREIADKISTPTFPVSKSAAGRWIKKLEREALAPPESARTELDEIEAEDADDAEEVEDEVPEIVLPKKDKQSSDTFIKKLGDISESITSTAKKAKNLTYSKKTLESMELSAKILQKSLDELTNTIMDLLC